MLVLGTGGPLELQDDLYNEGHGASTIDKPPIKWYVAPDGLSTTLNNEPHPGFPGPFSACEVNTCDAVSRKIVWAIFHHGIAPVALVEDGAHWVVVHGYDTTAHPTSSTDTSYGICGFDIKDPWPPASRLHPRVVPPHSTTDGCGTSKKRGLATQFVTYSKWKSLYMTAMPHRSHPSHWAGKFVAVCDVDPAPLVEGQALCAAFKKKTRKKSGRASTGSALLEKRDAGTAAIDGLRQYNVASRPGWGASLVEPTSGVPQLVQRLDLVDTFYYIVPILNGRQQTTAFVIVDGFDGEFHQAAATLRPQNVRPFDTLKALDRCIGQRIMLPDGGGSLVVRPEASSVHPAMVWRHCQESMSPYYPFHLITVGGHRLYIDEDGAIFTALHDGPFGS